MEKATNDCGGINGEYFYAKMQELIRNGHRAYDIMGRRVPLDPAYGPDPLAHMRRKAKRGA